MTPGQTPSIPVQSSLLASVRYQPAESILELEFCDGAIYRYSDVTTSIYDSLLAAESKGNYFNRQIRGYFPYALISPAR